MFIDNAPITLVLVDDDQLIRAGMRLLIEKIPNLSVIGEASNGRAALTLLEKVVPHVVLADVMMPRLNGIDLAFRIHQEH